MIHASQPSQVNIYTGLLLNNRKSTHSPGIIYLTNYICISANS